MANANIRVNRSFTVDSDLLVEVEKTKGPHSVSERVNQLLRAGLEAERKRRLALEAKEFFKRSSDRAERRAYQKASTRTWDRE